LQGTGGVKLKPTHARYGQSHEAADASSFFVSGATPTSIESSMQNQENAARDASENWRNDFTQVPFQQNLHASEFQPSNASEFQPSNATGFQPSNASGFRSSNIQGFAQSHPQSSFNPANVQAGVGQQVSGNSSEMALISAMQAISDLARSNRGPSHPAMNIQHFDGKAAEYVTFKRALMTHLNRSNISPAEKMLVLRGHLKGGAAAEIENLSINDYNYERCWLMLDNRYANRRKVIYDVYLSYLNAASQQGDGPADFSKSIQTIKGTNTTLIQCWRKVRPGSKLRLLWLP
jgi:hypothetical protein